MNEIEKIAKILDEADCVEDALFIDFDGMAVAYAWFLWEKGYKGETTVGWI